MPPAISAQSIALILLMNRCTPPRPQALPPKTRKMSLELYLLYLATIFLIIATPGPSALLVIQHASMHGAGKCLHNALGSITASFILITMSLAGIAFVLNELWLNTLSIIGALLLIYIGLSSFKSTKLVCRAEYLQCNREIFSEAFLTGISNPKDIIFFLALLPQFVNQSIPYYLSAITLVAGWVVLDFSIMMGYALVAHLVSCQFDKKAIKVTRMTSGALITLIGGALFTSSVTNLI